MADFIVSARKYRPMTFSTVVGQKGLTDTLKNAIKTNHLASAYLFSGPRGVGKTTCARIFAKTINCMNRTADFEACGECESCKSFAEGRSFCIHELDAASNNKVDDIRLLIDKVMVPPQVGQKSVYIIDEVHMLSTAAFNAFLKTLEEPPAYAIFILATTEKHKILPTILSRCQVYDFKRITIDDTIDHLANVAKKEGIEAEDEALAVIAKKADGGMRDALSIFDQVVSFCGNKITYNEVLQKLNVLDFEYYFKFMTQCKNGDVSGVLTIINEVISNGFDEGLFINDYAQHLRNVLMARDPKTVTLLDVSKHAQDQYVDAARDCEEDFLYKSLRIAVECGIQYPKFKNKRLLVELAAIRMCQIMAEKKNS